MLVDDPGKTKPNCNDIGNADLQQHDTPVKQIDLKCRERVTDSDVEDTAYDYRKPAKTTSTMKSAQNKGGTENEMVSSQFYLICLPLCA